MSDCAKVYFRYTLNILHLKTDIIQKIIQSSSVETLKHMLGLMLRNVHCAQVVLQIKFNYNALYQ